MIVLLAALIGSLVSPAWTDARKTETDKLIDAADLDLQNAQQHRSRSMKTNFLQARRSMMTEPGEIASVMVGDGENDLLEAYHKDKHFFNSAGDDAIVRPQALERFRVNPRAKLSAPPAKTLDIPGAGRQELAEFIKQNMDQPVKMRNVPLPHAETKSDDVAASILSKPFKTVKLQPATHPHSKTKPSYAAASILPKHSVKLQPAAHKKTKPSGAEPSILPKHVDTETHANERSKDSLKEYNENRKQSGLRSAVEEKEDKEIEEEYDNMMSEQENLEEEEEDEIVATSMDAGEGSEVYAETKGKQAKMSSQDEVGKLKDKLHNRKEEEVARVPVTPKPSMRENTWDALDSEGGQLLTEYAEKNMSLKGLAQPPDHTLRDDELLNNLTIDKKGTLWGTVEGYETLAGNSRSGSMTVHQKRIKPADTAATKPISDPVLLPARGRLEENSGSDKDFSNDVNKFIDKNKALDSMTSEFSRLRDEVFAGRPVTSLEPTKYQEKLEQYRSDFVKEVSANHSKQTGDTTHGHKITAKPSDINKAKNSSDMKSTEEATRLGGKAPKRPLSKDENTPASKLSHQTKKVADENKSNDQLPRYNKEQMSVKTSDDGKPLDTKRVLSADFYKAVGVPAGHSSQQGNVANKSARSSGKLQDNNATSEDQPAKLQHTNRTNDEGVLLRTVRQLQNKSATQANNTHETLAIAAQRTADPINETGQYACLIQGKNKSWTKGNAPATWELDKWQCLDMPESSNNTVTSFHTVTGSSCRVQFYGGSNCKNGKPLFETKKASLDKFRYTSGTNLANTAFNNKISSIRCSCTVEVVYMYQGFLRIPGSDCEGNLPGTKFFATKRFKKKRSDAAIACRISCKMYGDKCLGFKMWRMGASKASAAPEYECGFAEAFWFKSDTSLAAETYFAVDSEDEEAAPTCFIRTFGPR